MKKRVWVLIGTIIVIVLIGISLFYARAKKDIKDRKNVSEIKTWENYSVFIEDIDEMESILKIYDNNTKTEKEVEGIVGNLYGINWSNNGEYFIVNEGTSAVANTYIIPIKNLEDKTSMVTVGDVVFSPDSTKLLIGVENSKKRAVDTELNGTVDLAIYYINSKIVEPLLEADEYTDYWPEYWDENNNIGYIKASDGKEEALILKYKPSNEEIIVDIMNSEKNKENLRKFIGLLEKLDFDRLEKIYGEGSVLNLLEWLSQQKIEEDDILILISLIDDFIGEEYFAFIESIGNTYLRDKIKFIKILSKIPEKTEEIAYVLKDLNIYDRNDQNIFDDLDMIVNSEELTNSEKRVGIDLINIYAACGTW